MIQERMAPGLLRIVASLVCVLISIPCSAETLYQPTKDGVMGCDNAEAAMTPQPDSEEEPVQGCSPAVSGTFWKVVLDSSGAGQGKVVLMQLVPPDPDVPELYFVPSQMVDANGRHPAPPPGAATQ